MEYVIFVNRESTNIQFFTEDEKKCMNKKIGVIIMYPPNIPLVLNFIKVFNHNIDLTKNKLKKKKIPTPSLN